MEKLTDEGAFDDKTVSELLVAEDFTELQISYLNDMETKHKLTESMEKISDLFKNFRHEHMELKKLMAKTEHNENIQIMTKIV